MKYLLDMIEFFAAFGHALTAAIGVAFVLIVAGAAVMGRTRVAGAAVTIAGAAIPLLAVAGWLAWRGVTEARMARADEAVRQVHIHAIMDGERPEPGYVRIKGVARYEFGVVTQVGGMLFGTITQSYCYPVVPATHARKAPVIACTRGRSPGGTSESVTLEGMMGMRPVPRGFADMFLERSKIEVTDGALLLDEGVPPPSVARGAAVAGAAVLPAALLSLIAFLLLRRPRRGEG